MSNPLFSAIALTLFPEMFPGTLGHSLAGKALEKGLWSLEAINIRDFATDKHKTVDASPYGGGTGMVMKPDVVDAAIEHAKNTMKARSAGRASPERGSCESQQAFAEPLIIYTTPRGKPFTQQMAAELVQKDLILLCGRFEGVDQRVIDHHQMLEISLGDFVLSGGEIAAQAILDACVRLIPGVISKDDAITQESFGLSSDFARLLEYPHYTRPPLWNGVAVPEVLLSGNHEQIQHWRLEQAKEITATRRPDLLRKKDE